MPELSRVVRSLNDTPKADLITLLHKRLSQREHGWTERKLLPRFESATAKGLPSQECRILEYRTLLAHLKCHNHTTATADQAAPAVVAEENDEDWLLENLSNQWIYKLETRAGQELQKQKQEDAREQHRRIMSGKPLSEDEWDRLRAKSRKSERMANKKMWEECKAMTLEDWKRASGCKYTLEIQELLDLQMFHDTQRAELNSRLDTASALVSKAVAGADNLAGAADSHLSVLEDQTETTECLLDLCRQSMLRVHTRVRRLMATDVEGEAARQEEMRRRLEHPKALDYMFEGKTELEAARAVVNSTRRFVEDIEEDLEKIILVTVDAVGALKDARLGLDFRRDCAGYGV